MKSIFLDVDPGCDDALAIAYALHSADARLAGISASAGNDVVDVTFRNTAAVLDYLGRADVQIGMGSDRRDDFVRTRSSGTALNPIVERWSIPPRTAHGATQDVLLESIRNCPAGLTVVALAPLTNIADVLEQFPEESRSITDLVIFGGVFGESRWKRPNGAELNIYVDPHAAVRVVDLAAPRITLISLEVGDEVTLPAPLAQELRSAGTPESQLAADCFDQWYARYGAFPLWDVVTVAVALDPGLITEQLRAGVKVCVDEPNSGCTVLAERPVVKVVKSINTMEFMRRFRTAMGLPF